MKEPPTITEFTKYVMNNTNMLVHIISKYYETMCENWGILEHFEQTDENKQKKIEK